jgi:hypothetical protein
MKFERVSRLKKREYLVLVLIALIPLGIGALALTRLPPGFLGYLQL